MTITSAQLQEPGRLGPEPNPRRPDPGGSSPGEPGKGPLEFECLLDKLRDARDFIDDAVESDPGVSDGHDEEPLPPDAIPI